MSCIEGISKAIVSDCSTQKSGNLEVVAFLFNRKELSPTFDPATGNKITALALESTKQGYKITGVKRLLNAGHDLVAAEDRPDKFTHYFSFQQFEIAAADVKNVDEMNDIIAIVERKDKVDDADGVFVAYGVKFGLYKSADSRRANDVNGARSLEFTSMGGAEEPYSEYTVLDTDYATTKALLESLLVAAV